MPKVTGGGGKEYVSLANALGLALDLDKALKILGYYGEPSHGLAAREVIREIEG
ncbi:MAG: hypothetical protein IID15_03180 [Candidatus Marinimicrobia bacterium]|nr:hypothetical protein [Candidatus Neomarinimicrobiota bacterium]